MKSSEITTGVSYGVVPSWRYSNREARNPSQASRNQVVKANVVSMERYSYDVGRAAVENDANFQKVTDPKDRRFGYKVTDGSVYWIARPQDIVDVWVALEKRWKAQEAAQAAAAAEAAKRDEISRSLEAEADTYADQLRDTLVPLLQQITGKQFTGRFVKSYYNDRRERVNPFVNVEMDARLLERLVECVLQAQEA